MVSLTRGSQDVCARRGAKVVVPAAISVTVTVEGEGGARLLLGGGGSMHTSALSTTRVPNCWTAGESRSASKSSAVLAVTTTAMAASMPAVVGVGLLVREGRSALSLRCARGGGDGTAVVLRQATREKVVVLRYAFADVNAVVV